MIFNTQDLYVVIRKGYAVHTNDLESIHADYDEAVKEAEALNFEHYENIKKDNPDRPLDESRKPYKVVTLEDAIGEIIDEQREEASNEGYSHGFDNGKDEGYDAGYDEGLRDGTEEGRKEGDSEGYDRGYDNGYRDGKNDGEREC